MLENINENQIYRTDHYYLEKCVSKFFDMDHVEDEIHRRVYTQHEMSPTDEIIHVKESNFRRTPSNVIF